MQVMADDIIVMLRDAAKAATGRNVENGCLDCGLDGLLCEMAVDEIERLRVEISKAADVLGYYLHHTSLPKHETAMNRRAREVIALAARWRDD